MPSGELVGPTLKQTTGRDVTDGYSHSNRLRLMKSSICGKQYLAYLWELGELPAYIISGFGVL
jgi:hypothetical protein